MNYTLRVEHANRDDVPWLLEQLRSFDSFIGGARSLFPNDDKKARQFLHHMMDNHFLAVARAGVGVPRSTGFVGGWLTPHPFNDEIIVLTEAFWWVDPQERGTRAGAMLLHELLAFGRTHAHTIVMTLEEQSPVNPATLLKRGFKLKEHTYTLEVE